jgi:peptidoglycan/xylan/chitin deacetylase (PgdA/CDA1 family)
MSAGGRLALRIDVDFPAGLRRAVPRFLDALGRVGMGATFFVVAGSNPAPGLLRRLAEPGYLRRLRRLGLCGILRGLGPSLLGSQAFLASPEAAEALRRVAAEGHEIAVHGHDHAWWTRNAWRSDAGRLTGEVDRAFDVVERAADAEGLAWASPAWRTTGAVLRHLHGRRVPYLSECWGREPFLTRLDRGEILPMPHLPVTCPSLEASMIDGGLDAESAVAAALDGLRPGGIDVLCLHDYFEGLLRPDLFPLLLEGCRRRGLATCTLREAAVAASKLENLAPCALVRGPLPGFVGDVCWQHPGPAGASPLP